MKHQLYTKIIIDILLIEFLGLSQDSAEINCQMSIKPLDFLMNFRLDDFSPFVTFLHIPPHTKILPLDGGRAPQLTKGGENSKKMPQGMKIHHQR